MVPYPTCTPLLAQAGTAMPASWRIVTTVAVLLCRRQQGGKDGHKEEGGLNDKKNAIETGLFGVLYTLAKEKVSDSAKVAMLTIFVDFFLIMAVMLTTEYPWATNTDSWCAPLLLSPSPDHPARLTHVKPPTDPLPHPAHPPSPHRIWKFFWNIEFHKPIARQGYTFHLAIFYCLSGMLYLSVGVCFWVAWCFKNDNFPFLWPIKFLRVVVSLFFGMLYIASLNIFLVNLEVGGHSAVQCSSLPASALHSIGGRLPCSHLPRLAACAPLLRSGPCLPAVLQPRRYRRCRFAASARCALALLKSAP